MTRFGLVHSAKSCVGRFLADERGATAIEYGLMVALISVAIMTIVFTTGQNINNTLYGRIANALDAMF
jgi:pilus assembly protein Flp/PilA